MNPNIETVRQSIRVVWNSGHLDRIDDFYTEDFHAHYPPTGPSWGDTGPLPIAPTPTNKSIEVADFLHIRMEDGKIAEQWGLFDNFSMLLQLGVIATVAKALDP